MGGKAGTTTGLALLLAAGMAWAGEVPSGEGNRGLSLNILDMPVSSPNSEPVLIAQAAQLKTKQYPTIGICFLPSNYAQPDASNAFGFDAGVGAGVESYLSKAEGQKVILSETEWLQIYRTTRMVEAPLHGSIKLSLKDDEPNLYIPERGYLGFDQASFLVEARGRTIKIILFIKVGAGGGTDGYDPYYDKENCPHGPQWIIRSPRSGLPTIEIAPLSGSALAQTQGNSITLDTDAAGHGWYIDYTPYLNEEFLPTSNPYEWIAREGTDAYGKMDLLSVLWHEYGHAMGLDHNNRGQTMISVIVDDGETAVDTVIQRAA